MCIITHTIKDKTIFNFPLILSKHQNKLNQSKIHVWDNLLEKNYALDPLIIHTCAVFDWKGKKNVNQML